MHVLIAMGARGIYTPMMNLEYVNQTGVTYSWHPQSIYLVFFSPNNDLLLFSQVGTMLLLNQSVSLIFPINSTSSPVDLGYNIPLPSFCEIILGSTF
jgi:hypothetical protein